MAIDNLTVRLSVEVVTKWWFPPIRIAMTLLVMARVLAVDRAATWLAKYGTTINIRVDPAN